MTLEIFVLGAIVLLVYWSLKSHIDKRFKYLDRVHEEDKKGREKELEKAGDWFKEQFDEVKQRVSSVKEVLKKEEL